MRRGGKKMKKERKKCFAHRQRREGWVTYETGPTKAGTSGSSPS